MSGVSYDILSQFAKLVNKDKKTNVETTVYGTIVEDSNGNKYVKIDGTDQLTPYTVMPSVGSTDDENSAKNTTVAVDVDDRVSVSIKNHTATITGNISSPAAKNSEVQQIKQSDIVMANRVQAVEAIINDLEVEDFEAAKAKITELEASNATITGKLTAAEGKIDNLEATKIDASIVDAQFANITGQLNAVSADISNLEAQKASIEELNAVTANIDNLEAANATITGKLNAVEADIVKLDAIEADIDKLEANKASVNDLNATNANISNLNATKADIDFANVKTLESVVAIVEDLLKAGHIVTDDLDAIDGNFTNYLTGVRIVGDIIEGNTIKAKSLILVDDENGLYYQLNANSLGIDAVKLDKEKYSNALDGSAIVEKSITAQKITVQDLVAFGAKIADFTITSSDSKTGVPGTIYSGTKSGVNEDNSRGIYLDSHGQFAVGDSDNFVKFYKDTDGNHKLAVQAQKLVFGTGKKDVETAINEAQTKANTASEDLTNYISATNLTLESMQGQIDGSITTWFYEVAPTTSNAPAKDWNTTDLKNIHLGDLYYDTITGYCYRWQVANNVYSWQLVKDTDVTKALEDASVAKDTADKKRQVFTTTPKTPYDVGDLWVQGSAGDIMRCQTKKTEAQTYEASDWVKASKYTDDTVATNAQNTANTVQSNLNNLKVGGRNYLLNSLDEQFTDATSRAEFLKTTFDLAPFFDENGLVEVTLSFDAYAPVAGNVQVYCQNGSGSRYSFTKNINVTTDWQRYSVTFTPIGPDENFVESYLAFYGTYDSGVIPHVRKLKLEKGNKATDWSPSPDDTDATVDDLRKTISEQSANIMADNKKIILDALESYVETSDYDEFTYEVRSELNIMSNNISMNFTSTKEQIDDVDGDLQKVSEELQKHFEFTANGLTIKAGENNMKLRIDNNIIAFYKGEIDEAEPEKNRFGWWDGNYFHTGNIMVKLNERAQFGNFAFIPRSNGSLDFLKVGG